MALVSSESDTLTLTFNISQSVRARLIILSPKYRLLLIYFSFPFQGVCVVNSKGSVGYREIIHATLCPKT